jgi:hypothetical protein
MASYESRVRCAPAAAAYGLAAPIVIAYSSRMLSSNNVTGRLIVDLLFSSP